ncbi:hypothetical protein [Streptomyces sp. CB02460]|uniref:hypothetical protein n=1 Tax=Streptomyces sp. CB02460 TaxID=1703941 RepID=UPI00093C7CAF|nr:hypothetical protein [Streptomyces sp. CB02460]OKJ78320.1 hypothetical protein AMK30_04800 [Streptomyces sp. CB02460]
MNATFEDRLLEELKREIEARAPRPTPARPRRLVTAPRLALVAGLATAATVAAVLLPGSPTTPKAYAVDRNGDGSVTVTLYDLTPDPEEQDALVARVRELGVLVSIDSPPDGTTCTQPRGKVIQSPAGVADPGMKIDIAKPAEAPPGVPTPPVTKRKAPDSDTGWRATLHPGDTLVIEHDHEIAWFSAIKGTATPCNPRPVTQPPPATDD